MIRDLQFQPWVPELYSNGNARYGKLLILGESHYSDKIPTYDEEQKDLIVTTEEEGIVKKTSFVEFCGNFTTDIVSEFINKDSNIRFFSNLGLLFNAEDRYELWNNAAFANGIQALLPDSRSQPSRGEIETIKQSFWILLDNLKPDKVIVCSQRMWNYWLPDDNERGYLLTHITANGKHSTVWKYSREGGNTYAMAINHPSKFFSYINWKPLVEEFITRNFNDTI